MPGHYNHNENANNYFTFGLGDLNAKENNKLFIVAKYYL